jgi:hypothetical protein
MTGTRKTPPEAPKGGTVATPLPEFLSREERLATGKALRDKVPREHHAAFKRQAKGRATSTCWKSPAVIDYPIWCPSVTD